MPVQGSELPASRISVSRLDVGFWFSVLPGSRNTTVFLFIIISLFGDYFISHIRWISSHQG